MELITLPVGFFVGIILGVLYFEIFSCKNPKTREEAELLLTNLPPEADIENMPSYEIESWIDQSTTKRP